MDDESEDTDNESEDNSDFKVVAASLIQKKKSGPTNVKQHCTRTTTTRGRFFF